MSPSALPTGLDPLLVTPLIDVALREDLGRGGDLTTNAIVPADRAAVARIISPANYPPICWRKRSTILVR